MADDLRAALRERLAENLWDATFKNGIHTDWALIQEGLGTKENYRRMAEALLDDWVPRAEHEQALRRLETQVAQRFYVLGDHLHNWQDASHYLRKQYRAAANGTWTVDQESAADLRAALDSLEVRDG